MVNLKRLLVVLLIRVSRYGRSETSLSPQMLGSGNF